MSAINPLSTVATVPPPLIVDGDGVEDLSLKYDSIISKNLGNGALSDLKIVFDPIKQFIMDEQDSTKRYRDSLQTIKTELDMLYFQIAKCQLQSQFESKSEDGSSVLQDNSFSFSVALNKVKSLRYRIINLQSNILNRSDKYSAFSDLYKDLISKDKDEEVKLADAEIKVIYQKMISAISDASDAVSTAKVTPLLSTLISIQNNSGDTYTTFPIQFKGEQSRVTVSITPIKSEATLQSYTAQIVFPLNKLLYIAVGPSFYVSWLYNQAYSVSGTKIDTTTTYKLIDENPVKVEFGSALLLRFGTDLCQKVNYLGVHLSFGPGISISNTLRPRILYGGGLSLGRTNMFTFDGGLISGYVDELSNVYNTNSVYVIQPASVTVAKLRTAGFLALGYSYRF